MVWTPGGTFRIGIQTPLSGRSVRPTASSPTGSTGISTSGSRDSSSSSTTCGNPANLNGLPACGDKARQSKCSLTGHVSRNHPGWSGMMVLLAARLARVWSMNMNRKSGGASRRPRSALRTLERLARPRGGEGPADRSRWNRARQEGCRCSAYAWGNKLLPGDRHVPTLGKASFRGGVARDGYQRTSPSGDPANGYSLPDDRQRLGMDDKNWSLPRIHEEIKACACAQSWRPAGSDADPTKPTSPVGRRCSRWFLLCAPNYCRHPRPAAHSGAGRLRQPATLAFAASFINLESALSALATAGRAQRPRRAMLAKTRRCGSMSQGAS